MDKDIKQLEKDHNLLHLMFDEPNPSSQNPLVLNDAYGSKHTWYADNPTLTKSQIKLMHDKLTTELGYDDTPMELVDEVMPEEKKEEDPWKKIIINSDVYNPMTKGEVFRYYSDKDIRHKLLSAVKDKPLMVRQSLDPNQIILRRKDIKISRDRGDAFDKEDYQYYIERRFTEFNPAFEDLSDDLVVDIDPGDDVQFNDVKKIAAEVSDVLERQPYIKGTSFQFSGNKGLYVWGKMDGKKKMSDIRSKLSELLSSFKNLAGIDITTGVRSSSKQVRLDLSPIKELGPIKAPWSLDSRTGLVSLPLDREDLDKFTPGDAAVKSVLGYYPSSAYSFKYEQNV